MKSGASAVAPRLREILQTTASPDPRHDYVVGVRGSVGDAAVEARYVPDLLIATPGSLAAYFSALDSTLGAEALALAILDDLNNELVPRWAQVVVTRDQPLRHWATVEDQQPNWVPAARLLQGG